MTPARRDHIARMAVNVAEHRGRTVPPIREGGGFDGRAVAAGDADGFRIEATRELENAQC